MSRRLVPVRALCLSFFGSEESGLFLAIVLHPCVRFGSGISSVAMSFDRPGILLFDMGGVLVRWDGIDAIRGLMKEPVERDVAIRFWLHSSWVRQYERGLCSSSEFAQGVVREFNLDISPDEFLVIFDSWVPAPFPGAFDLIDSLAPHFTLACLSNTNELHGRKIRHDFGFESRLKPSYFSYELGLVKPDPSVFSYVIKDLACAPREILFFDDTAECVVAARESGLQAEQVQGVEGIREVLVTRGLALGDQGR